MNKGRWAHLIHSRYPVAILAGLMLALPFNWSSLASLAWLSPGMLIMAAHGQSGRQAFRIGYLGGLVYCLVSLYWLLLNPFLAGAIAGWIALCAYLALYYAAWVWLAWRWFPYCQKNESANGTSPAGRGEFWGSSWWRRAAWALTCAALWVALEMVRGRLFSGFTWNILGVSQYQILPVIQIASLCGVYGISFMVVWFSVCLASAAVILIRRPTERWQWLPELLPPGLGLLITCAFGFTQLAHQPAPSRTLRMALVQPSIPQTLIWDPQENTNRFRKLIQLSELALTAKPDLLVWPEAAVPNYVRYDAEFTLPAITNLVRQHQVWLILGADDAAPHPGSQETNDYDFFNSSMLVNPNGDLVSIYRKQQLVIFGEYVPLIRWLPFLKRLTPIDGGFTAGDRPVPFLLPPLRVKTSVLICFEDVFPHLARHYVEEDTDFLLNLTNDGWFGESAAQWQQAANAAFRAVENGLPLVRCANNGLTCWIDATGRMFDVYFGDSRDIYGAGFKIVQVPLLNIGQKRPPTFYNRAGDVFGWACVIVCGLRLIPLAWQRKRRMTVD